MKKKIIVIGGGPGGYVAALYAAIKGAEVVLVEKDKVGGTCLNRGCIPTKAFLKSAEVYANASGAEAFGITTGKVEANFPEIGKRKDAVVRQLVGGVEFLLKNKNVTVMPGTGRLLKGNEVEVTDAEGNKKIEKADAVILAAGSKPALPTMFGYDGKRVISSDEALGFQTLPKSLIICGGGVIGCEFGQFFANMGTKVMIAEMAPHILPNEDAEVAAVIKRSMKTSGVEIAEGIGIAEVIKGENSVKAVLSNDEVWEAEYLLVSIGRTSNTANLVAEDVKLDIERGKVVVNDKMQTSLENVYAIGDLVNTPFLAHVASREAVVAVDNILGGDSHAVYHAVPRCLYTSPEIGAVGVTEDELKAKNYKYHKGTFRFAGIGKAMIMGHTEGFVKVLTDEKDVIIGASVVGPQATDLLTELTLAVHLGLTARQVGEVIHPHPTLSEALMEAIHDVHGESVHQY